MTNKLSPWAFGASLYTPATRSDLVHLGTNAFPQLGSLIYCTEDSVLEQDLPLALRNLADALPQLSEAVGPIRLIRVRSPQVLASLSEMDLGGIYGFVLPKVHAGNLREYTRLLEVGPLKNKQLMLSLETREVFSEKEMLILREMLLNTGLSKNISMLRIGGNDLLHLLGLRRQPKCTLYEGPLERVISMLVGIFKPYGFALSSPVYEVFSDAATLAREVRQDLACGLSAKTIIHPCQLLTVLEGFQVSAADLAEARAILQPQAAAVFSLNGRMCEPATHSNWARAILERSERYGISAGTDN